MTTRLSVIILTWNQRDVLHRCLCSLMPAIEGISHEVIVVDNGSSDGSLQMLEQSFPEVTVIANAENRGVAAARNQGITASTGRYILILDNDTVVNAEAIEGMLTYLEQNPQAGIVACRLLNEDHTVQNSMKPYPGLIQKMRNVLRLTTSTTRFRTDEHGVIYPTYVIGACQMFPRLLIDTIGLLDDNIFYGPEDADFCLRATQAGYKVCYLPHICIEHLHRRITSHNLLSPMARRHARALLYFYRKHHRWLY